MNFEKRIDFINSTKNLTLMSFSEEIINISDGFIKSNTDNRTLAIKILDCLNNVRYSFRDLDGDMEMKFLDNSLSISRKFQIKLYLKNDLKSAIYYSNYYPKKYNKKELEQELNKINKKEITVINIIGKEFRNIKALQSSMQNNIDKLIFKKKTYLNLSIHNKMIKLKLEDDFKKNKVAIGSYKIDGKTIKIIWNTFFDNINISFVGEILLQGDAIKGIFYKGKVQISPERVYHKIII